MSDRTSVRFTLCHMFDVMGTSQDIHPTPTTIRLSPIPGHNVSGYSRSHEDSVRRRMGSLSLRNM